MKSSKIIISVVIYTSLLTVSIHTYIKQQAQPVISDAGRLLPIKVKRIESVEDEKKLQQFVRDANASNEKLSIAGMQHTQGGHTYYPNGTVLDMKSYNKILEFNPKQKRIRVQSGATWNDIQKVINPYGLAIQAMQSQNIFTIGGSLSANVHRRDIRHDALIDTVDSFRLLMADGNIKNVS